MWAGLIGIAQAEIGSAEKRVDRCLADAAKHMSLVLVDGTGSR